MRVDSVVFKDIFSEKCRYEFDTFVQSVHVLGTV